MNNIVTKEIKHLPPLFAIAPQIALKQKRHYFSPWSTITTKSAYKLYFPIAETQQFSPC